MIRPIPIVIAALLVLAGCGAKDDAGPAGGAANQTAETDNLTVEDLPSDGLAAPADMPMDSESNAVGSASGGNVM